MADADPHADTPLADIAGLNAAARRKLQAMGVQTLGQLAQQLSRPQLQRTRHIGPKSIELIERLLLQAGLELREIRSLGSAGLQSQVRRFSDQTEQLKTDVEAWVKARQPEVYQAWRQHEEGSWGQYLSAQLLALNEVSADTVVRREFEHQLVRSLHRYRRQQRYAKSKDALMDGITALGRSPINDPGGQDNGN